MKRLNPNALRNLRTQSTAFSAKFTTGGGINRKLKPVSLAGPKIRPDDGKKAGESPPDSLFVHDKSE